MIARRNPFNDDDYSGNDEQIDDLKELASELLETLELTHAWLDGLELNGARYKDTGLFNKICAAIAKAKGGQS